MAKRNIIVIGASTGGAEAISTLVAGLPEKFKASVFIVWHLAPDSQGLLPAIINKLGTMPAKHPQDMELIEPGTIYVAPPDRHLIIEGNRARITRGPKENRFRPAVDPLFRAAAYYHGARVIGVILSGALDDGTAGLRAVKESGGIGIVQEPAEAIEKGMCESAIEEGLADYIVSVKEMPGLLSRLCSEEITETTNTIKMDRQQNLKNEIAAALLSTPANGKGYHFGELSPYSCPECHGVLAAIKEGGRVRFRCHTGHAFSIDSLVSALSDNIEQSLWNALRGMEELVLLLNHAGDHIADINQPKKAAQYFKRAEEVGSHIELVNQALGENSVEKSEANREHKRAAKSGG